MEKVSNTGRGGGGGGGGGEGGGRGALTKKGIIDLAIELIPLEMEINDVINKAHLGFYLL